MRTPIGQLLVRDDLVSEAQLARALEVQNFAGGRIGTLLMERGVLGEDNLGRMLALQHECGYVPWSALAEIPGETIAVVPARFALKHCAVPYERGEGYVKMALRDPSDLRILDELVFVTGRKVLVGVAPEVRIYQALEKYYGKLRAARYAALAEKLSRPRAAPIRPAAPPPPPDFFAGFAPASPLASDAGREPVEPGAEIPSEEQPAGWASFLSPGSEPASSAEPEGIAWEDTTGTRSKKRPETPPAPFEEAAAFDFSSSFDALKDSPAPTPAPRVAEEGFSQILSATERDAIADAVLEALVRRFSRAAIFSSRSDGVSGWAAAGSPVNRAALRAFAASWTEPSVFLNARLSRTFYLGPLPPLPRHDELAAALGGWPGECLVHPVLIREKPVAFLLAAAAEPGSVTADDLAYVRELAEAASSALANAIQLKKKEI
jgi:hypothetical protein